MCDVYMTAFHLPVHAAAIGLKPTDRGANDSETSEEPSKHKTDSNLTGEGETRKSHVAFNEAFSSTGGKKAIAISGKEAHAEEGLDAGGATMGNGFDGQRKRGGDEDVEEGNGLFTLSLVRDIQKDMKRLCVENAGKFNAMFCGQIGVIHSLSRMRFSTSRYMWSDRLF